MDYSKIDLSIIVPAYNVEPFIERCLVSLCEQNYDPSLFEVIVVDDGSPDDSKSIVQRLQKKYSNLIYIWQTNGNLGKARNTGIKSARGRYIAFVDSDDCWNYSNVIEKMIPLCDQHQLDILSSNSFTYIEENAPLQMEYNQKELNLTLHNRNTFLCLKDFAYNVWLSFYKKDVISSISFRENCAYEDSDWYLKTAWAATGQIGRISWDFYGYRNNPASITRCAKIQTFHDNIAATVSIVNFLNSCQKMEKMVYDMCINRVKKSILSWIYTYKHFPVFENFKAFSKTKSSGLLKLQFPHTNLQEKFFLFILRHSWLRYVLLLIIHITWLIKRNLLKK